MSIYKNTIKLFCNTRSVSIPYLILILAENFFLFQLLRSFVKADPIDAQHIYYIADLNVLCVLFFLFFLFVSNEFMRKGKSINIDETMRNRAWLIDSAQFLVLITAVVVAAVVFSIYILLGYCFLDMPALCMREMGRVLFVNIFLMSLAAIGMGSLLSYISNRFIGYLIMLAILYIILPSTARSMVLWPTSKYMFFIRDFFYVLPPDIDAFADPLYGMPMEFYRIATMLIWMGIGGGCFLHSMFRWKRKKIWVVRSALVVWIVIFGVQVVCRGSVLNMVWHSESGQMESARDCSNLSEEQKEKVDFQVSHYEMAFDIGRQLSAEVTTTIAEGDSLSEYIFTLYRGYEVQGITDAKGKPLTFEQKRDQVRIQNSDNVDCSRITMSYKGKSAMFYANKNACFLPGCFPYYPRAGVKNVVVEDNYVCQDTTPSHFKVSVKGLDVISNLPATEYGFEGDSSNILLMGGLCQVEEIEGVRQVTYPLHSDSKRYGGIFENEDFLKDWQDTLQFYKLEDSDLISFPDTKKLRVVVPASSMYGGFSYYEGQDYVLIGRAILADELIKNQIKEKIKTKENLVGALFDVLSYRERTEEELSDLMWEEEEEVAKLPKSMRCNEYLMRKMVEYGIEPVKEKVMEYLLDDSNQMDEEEFILNLKIETEEN